MQSSRTKSRKCPNCEKSPLHENGFIGINKVWVCYGCGYRCL